MANFWSKFKTWALNAGSTAVSAGLVAGVVTFALNDWQDSRSKKREAEYALIQKIRDRQNEALDKFFSDDVDDINKISQAYIGEVIKQRPTKKTAVELSGLLTKRIRQAEALKVIFPSPTIAIQISDYQNAMQNFANAIDDFKTAIQMKNWSTDYVKMQNIAVELEKSLRDEANKPISNS